VPVPGGGGAGKGLMGRRARGPGGGTRWLVRGCAWPAVVTAAHCMGRTRGGQVVRPAWRRRPGDRRRFRGSGVPRPPPPPVLSPGVGWSGRCAPLPVQRAFCCWTLECGVGGSFGSREAGGRRPAFSSRREGEGPSARGLGGLSPRWCAVGPRTHPPRNLLSKTSDLCWRRQQGVFVAKTHA
jgi:hypothetical protein